MQIVSVQIASLDGERKQGTVSFGRRGGRPPSSPYPRGSSESVRAPTKQIETGIVKLQVAGIDLKRDGVVGDNVVNTRDHGGPDQAVYAYSMEDYEWWEAELQRPLSPGQFGENLTLSDFSVPTRVGDRYRIGDVLLEVTAGRIPCGTLAAHMGVTDFVARFRDARRPGWYARVIADGVVAPGAEVDFEPAPTSNVDILEVQDLYYDHSPDISDRLRHALRSPLAERTRTSFQRRVAEG